MQVAQRGTQTGQGASNVYSAVDRFQITSSSTNGRLTSSQTTDVPAGFSKSLQLVCTTADTSIAAGEFTRIRHRIEGQNLQHIQKGTSGAKPITLSYHAKASTGGVIIVEIQDADNNRISSVAHTITTSYQKFTHTFPADTTGVLDNDNNNSLTISWVLHAGSNYTSGTLGSTFATGVDANKAVGQTFSIFAATSRQFNLSGVQLEVGSAATDFEHRSFAEDLSLCERYFYMTYPYGETIGAASGSSYLGRFLDNTQSYGSIQVPNVNMRAAPTRVIYNTATGTAGSLRSDSNNHNAAITGTAAKGGGWIYANATSIGTSVSIKAHLTMDAEL